MNRLQTNVNLPVYPKRGRTSMSKRTLASALILITVSMVASCAGRDAVSVEDLAPQTSADAPGYIVGPGDLLQIFVFDHPELTTNVQVRPDGRISTPLVEDLTAAGRSPTQLAREIEVALSEYVRSPVVTVIPQSFVGEPEQQIRVIGQAVSPQALQYRNGLTVLDVIIQVGGLSEFAAGNRATVVRRNGGEALNIRVRLDDLLNDGDIDQNIPMLPGDVLVIPESRF